MGFKWRFKVTMLLHSRMSAGRVSGGWSSNRKSATGQFGVCEERRASAERRARGGARVCTSSLRYVGVAVAASESVQPVYR